MDSLGREGGQTDRDVLSTIRGGRAVLYPFPGASEDGLAGVDFECAGSVRDAQLAAQHDGVFVKIGRLARAPHVGDADRLIARIYAADILVNQFRFVPRGRDSGC